MSILANLSFKLLFFSIWFDKCSRLNAVGLIITRDWQHFDFRIGNTNENSATAGVAPSCVIPKLQQLHYDSETFSISLISDTKTFIVVY